MRAWNSGWSLLNYDVPGVTLGRHVRLGFLCLCPPSGIFSLESVGLCKDGLANIIRLGIECGFRDFFHDT